jgi:HlyD family secretion protein
MKYNFLILSFFSFLFFNCGEKKDETKQKPAPTSTQIKNEVDKIVGIANIEPIGKILPISAETNGIITKILVEANDSVTSGQTLILLDYAVEESQLAQAKSKLATQQSIINTAKANVASMQVRLENAKTNFLRNQKLLEGNATTQQTLDDSKFQYEQLQKDLMSLQATISQQESRLNELQADIQYHQTLVQRKIIKAHTNGKILSLDAKLGSSVSNTTNLGDFAPAGALMAIVEVDELFADKIMLNQKASVRNQGSTKNIANGKVIFASPYLKKKSLFADKAENMEDRRVREVRVELDKNSNVLIGSRLECVIYLK